MAKTYSLLVSGVAGAVVLALEVLAARTMAPVLGSGPVSWSSLLATALGMLAIGNLLGGYWSARGSALATVAWAMTIAAAYLTVLSYGYGPALRWSAEQPLLAGELIAAMVIQGVPVMMLGMMPPVILQHGRGGTAHWAALVLAAGSGGGIVGALATGLFFIPALGLAHSFLVLAGILAVAAIPAVWRGRCWLAALLILAAAAFAVWCQYRAKQGHVVESFYGELEVQTNDVATVLTIDGLQQTAVPKRLASGDARGYGYLLELATAMRPETRSAFVIGLGGGLAPRVLAMHGIRCATVELDPEVIAIARREFAFTGDAIVGDGRAVLARTSERYDLIFLDACTADRLPWHLFTLEAMRLARDRLTPTGMLAIQFIGDDGRWSASLVRTVDATFGPHRSMVLASAAASSPVGLRWLFVGRDATLQLPNDSHTYGRFRRWRKIDLSATGWVLTDDHFPAELAWAETALHWRDLCGGRR